MEIENNELSGDDVIHRVIKLYELGCKSARHL